MAAESVPTPPPSGHAAAARWLKQVGGRAFRNREAPDGPQGWVAAVAAPTGSGGATELILATGPSLAAATEAARREWDRRWQRSAARDD